MKKTIAAFFGFVFCLAAADFWQSKPASEWNEKELQKILNNSPWAHQISVSVNGPTPPSIGRGGPPVSDDTGAPAPISAGGGGGRGGRGGGGGGGLPDAAGEAGGGASTPIVIRWQTAMVVKQALVRMKFGPAETSADAKQMLEREDPGYVISLSGPLRPFLRGNGDALKKSIMDVSSLSAKGKDTLKPMSVEIGGAARSIEIMLIFPKSAAYTLEDKEVEFSTRLSDLPLRSKFRLKDMAINGKLEL